MRHCGYDDRRRVGEVLLELYPRKVSMAAQQSDNAVDELVAFWRFVDRAYEIEHAGEIADYVEEVRDAFVEAMSDTDNFGLAKSLLMMGEDAGFDMTTQSGTDEFIQSCNQALAAHQAEATPPPPVSAEEKRIDRKKRKKLLAAKTRSKKKR